MVPRRTHYDVLGVEPDADAASIREAYRRLAREYHPDRLASASGASLEVSMPEINEAYRVLNESARRAAYDAELRGTPPPTTRGPAAPARTGRIREPSGPGEPLTGERFAGHHGPARIPWRSLLFVGALACVAIVALAQFVEPGEPGRPDGIIEIGSCVSIESNNDAREVACTGDPAIDRVVEAFVPFDSACPTGTLAHRDRQGMGVACIAATGEIRG